ncbi:MAG: DUF6946 family protein [Solirubrobacteraceae bacterium]
MTLIRIPTRRPEDWRAFLADPVIQWRVGYSAYELAHAWQAAARFPPKVAQALATGSFAPIEMLFGLPEHKVKIEGQGAASASDLFVIARRVGVGGLVTIAVEGKVGESFDRPVWKWLKAAKNENRQKRLDGLVGLLELKSSELDDVPYQLLHRAAAAIIEAKNLNAGDAVLLVHSFSGSKAHLADYQTLVRLLGGSGEPGVVESAGERSGVRLHVCWVADEPMVQAHAGDPEAVLLQALDWLRDTYRQHRFFKERDVEGALQARMNELFEERRADWRVYENHKLPGKQLDLAVVDRRRPANVVLGVELKFEPDHARAGGDIRGDTAKFPVCLADEIARDVDAVRRCVTEGLMDLGYALLVDEGGYWRSRQTPPGGECQISGSDTKTQGTGAIRHAGHFPERPAALREQRRPFLKAYRYGATRRRRALHAVRHAQRNPPGR